MVDLFFFEPTGTVGNSPHGYNDSLHYWMQCERGSSLSHLQPPTLRFMLAGVFHNGFARQKVSSGLCCPLTNPNVLVLLDLFVILSTNFSRYADYF